MLITILILFSLTSCNNNSNNIQEPSKFKAGDIVYLKPDSTKVVVSLIFSNDILVVSYTDSLKVRHDKSIFISEIY